MKRSHRTTFELLINSSVRMGVNRYPFLPVFTPPHRVWPLRGHGWQVAKRDHLCEHLKTTQVIYKHF